MTRNTKASETISEPSASKDPVSKARYNLEAKGSSLGIQKIKRRLRRRQRESRKYQRDNYSVISLA